MTRRHSTRRLIIGAIVYGSLMIVALTIVILAFWMYID